MCHSIVSLYTGSGYVVSILWTAFKLDSPPAYTRYDYKVMRLKKPPTTNTPDLIYEMSVVL